MGQVIDNPIKEDIMVAVVIDSLAITDRMVIDIVAIIVVAISILIKQTQIAYHLH